MKALIRALAHPRDYHWTTLRPWRRHSLVLFIGGAVYVAYGASLILQEPTRNRINSLDWLLDLLPVDAWGIVWVIAGSMSLISTRWPEASTKWGYSVLSGMSILWCCGYGAGLVFKSTPETAVGGLLVWGLVATLWWAVAGLSNPDDLLMHLDTED